MNDYNNGEVWGWNGGECPVHPKTKVKVWFRGKGSGTSLAFGYRWNRADLGGDITAFQVVKAYVEPKTIWVNELFNGQIAAHRTEDNAKKRAVNAVRIAVKYVEARDE
jgi:hypothetical protein